MLDPKRLVEVKGAKTGSGYLIAKGLILAAGHLAGTGTKVQVTLLAERLASGNSDAPACPRPVAERRP
jgi:S1-C subfamily serine protease